MIKKKRNILNNKVGKFLDVRLTLAALEAAVRSRDPQPGLIQHSDRGGQYAALLYREHLHEIGAPIVCSMGFTPANNIRNNLNAAVDLWGIL